MGLQVRQDPQDRLGQGQQGSRELRGQLGRQELVQLAQPEQQVPLDRQGPG